MGRPSERKRRKQLARTKAKSAKKSELAARRKYRENFPEFVYGENGAPPQFVKVVKDTIRKINFLDRREFQPWETEVFRNIKQAGSEPLYELCDAEDQEKRLVASHFLSRLQKLVLSRIPRDELRRWCPYHGVDISLVGRKIRVTFYSLSSESGPNGTIYFSRWRPKLEIDGQRKIVGFSRHAIERICDRALLAVDPVAVLGCAACVVDACVYFERAALSDGQLAFSFFFPCLRDSSNEIFIKAVLGEAATWNDNYYYRVGYCPAVVEGEFIVAKTLLFPGYQPTPESRLMWKSDVSFDRKKRINQRIQNWGKESEWSKSALEHFQFFQEQGIPQVIESEEEFYRCPV